MPGLVVDRRVLPHREVQEDDARGGEVAADGDDLLRRTCGSAGSRRCPRGRSRTRTRCGSRWRSTRSRRGRRRRRSAGGAAPWRRRTPAAPRRRRAAAPRGRARPGRRRSRERAQRSAMEELRPGTEVTGTRGRPREAAATKAWAASAGRPTGTRATSCAGGWTPSSRSTAGAASTGAVIQQEPYPMACAAVQSSWTAPPRLWRSGRCRSRSRSSRGSRRRSWSSSASEW